jgi:hypothetical protein
MRSNTSRNARHMVYGIVLACFSALWPIDAYAYIGPGAGITAIGTVVALFGTILLGIIGFVWYPFKRLLAKMKKKGDTDQRGAPS